MTPSTKLLSRGAFADVFDLGDGTVAKAFRRIRQTDAPVNDWSDHEFIIQQLFATEVRAYQRLESSPLAASPTTSARPCG